MTRDDIIRLARESGIIQPEIVFTHLERFAALVAAAEREACAKLCEDAGEPDGRDLADKIRERGQE
jgi:hypothetical protein